MKIIVTGASGFIGRHLTQALLDRGDTVVALTRDPDRTWSKLPRGVDVKAWNPPAIGSAQDAFNDADGVVNLAGEPVADKRWTEAQKQKVLGSRVNATKAVVAAIANANPRPRVLVNQSAIGYYGDRGEATVTEASDAGDDFLAHVVEEWESSANPVEELGVRLVLTRSAIVLGSDGGALPRLALPFKLFVGGTMGRPEQWVSWIHIDDEVALIIFALTNEEVTGPINATAPNPVTMKQFSAEIGAALHRPSWVPLLRVPMKLAFGERGEAVLASQRALPVAAERLGFSFRYRDRASALQDVLGGQPS